MPGSRLGSDELVRPATTERRLVTGTVTERGLVGFVVFLLVKAAQLVRSWRGGGV